MTAVRSVPSSPERVTPTEAGLRPSRSLSSYQALVTVTRARSAGSVLSTRAVAPSATSTAWIAASAP